MVMVKVWGAEVSWPPPSMPPSSWARTVTVATPLAFGADSKINVPSGPIAGGVMNMSGLSFSTVKLTCWRNSNAGPADRLVAHGIRWKRESSGTVTFGPAVKDGAAFGGVRRTLRRTPSDDTASAMIWPLPLIDVALNRV